jgi:hypothetical protein
MLFNGEGVEKDTLEGLMWLTIASRHSAGTSDADWISDLLNKDMSVATADERKQAVVLADKYQDRFAPP